MARIRSAAFVTVLSTAAGIGMAASPGHAEDVFTPVSTVEAFSRHFVGPRIVDPADEGNFFRFMADGTILGTWHGQQMAGTWQWEDAPLCRTLTAPRPAPEDCQQWFVGDGMARLVRARGTGDATDYALGE